jgi:hypothetical protein
MDKQRMAISKNSPRDEKGRVIKKTKLPAVTTAPATVPPANVEATVEAVSVSQVPRRITALLPQDLYKKLAHYAVDLDVTVTDALTKILREKLG